MKKLFLIYNYCVYRLRAVNEHSVHSPFVFDLLTKVIYNRVDYYSFKKIENLREQLLDSKKINTKHISNSPKYGQLLFRLVNYFQPSQVIELGATSVISAAYMASVSSKINVITDNCEVALPNILAKCESLGFVYFAGNHSKQATLSYFKQCVEKASETSVFIFENMYCSPETKETWNEIKNNDRVKVTLDLFFMGIVFFRQEQAKQHFLIKFAF